MKKLLLLFVVLVCLESSAQKVFTTQAQVDSFVTFANDTSINYLLIFKYDKNVPKSQEITDLSGFNNNRIVRITLEGFDWKDIPWFTSIVNGGVNVKDMPNLETISGIKGYEGSHFVINNCPSLKSYPPKGLLKYCNDMFIYNMDVDELVVDLSGVTKYPGGANWANSLTISDNDIKKLIVNDPNGVAQDFSVQYDSSMTYLEFNSSYNSTFLTIYANSELTDIRGFTKTDFVSLFTISYNPKLSDVCALRKGLDAYYQWLPTRDKPTFNNSGLVANGYGASSYQEMMADSCEWLKYVSVKEKQVSFANLLVYPNPANDKFTVKLNNQNLSGVVKLYNLQGSIVAQKEVQENENQLSFYTSSLPRGIYLLEFVGRNGERENVKVVLQ